MSKKGSLNSIKNTSSGKSIVVKKPKRGGYRL